jgi:DNA modification methylase
MMVTDPPYGVEYDPSWRITAGLSTDAATGKVQNDDRCDWQAAYELFSGDVVYVWHGHKMLVPLAGHLDACNFDRRALIVWRKSRFAISRGHYHWQFESAWYGVRDGATAGWCGDRKQSTVWDIDHTQNPTGHGTQKPVECMARPIRHHGKTGDIVYDPFLGSGTTLVAAHAEGRVCYGMEIDPPYVDVSVTRWQEYTNEEAILDGDGRTFEEVKAERLSGEDVAQAQAAG